MSPEKLPKWESDFWMDLMEEQHVKDRVADEKPYVSPYNVGDVLVGEIVEDEPLCINP